MELFCREQYLSKIRGFYHDTDIIKVITGSNSYLLSGELATKLTGRYVEFELFTLNFNE